MTRFYIMTLLSVVVVLALKSYTITAQDRIVNDSEVEEMASMKLINRSDTVRHQMMINRFVGNIKKSDILYSKYFGAADFPTEVYADYERIQRVGTVQELNTLLAHESPIIRIYAHKALVANKMPINVDLLELLLNDTTQVVYYNNNIISDEQVMDLVCENVFVLATKE